MTYSYRFRRLPKFVQNELLDRDLRIAQAVQDGLKHDRIQRWRERKAEERRRREARERESAEFQKRNAAG
jgi:hypothetical protein